MTKEEKSLSSKSKIGDEHPTKEKSTRQRGQKREKVKPLTKIIIRHLPPTMTEEEFLKQIDPLPEHDFYYFAAADWSLGYDATCRAYLNLKNYDDVFLFRDRFDGYVFVDSKGAEFAAIVEFAPFQGLAKNKSRKTDPKVNTIEIETHYKNFLAKLEEDRELAAKGGESKLEFSLDRKKEEKITSTPLLQYLANKKEKRREESKRRTEEKRRQRDEEKERRQRNQQQVTKIMTVQDSGGGAGKKESTSKSTGGKDNADNPPEEQKNSRSKRRLERNQRRREAYEQKKREKEILEREQKEKDPISGKADESKLKSESTGKSEETAKSSRNIEENKSNDSKTEDTYRRESKKYSERRERDRNRNRKEREKERPKDETTLSNTTIQAEKSSKEPPKTQTTKTEEVSESVKNFIRSVVAVKEFVPKHKQLEAEQRENALKTATDEKLDIQDATEELEKTLTDATDEKNSAEKPAKSKSESSDVADEKQTQKQRLAEERRIRNKDRPSIAIYQPKPRLRQSEESDGNAVKEARSSPTSDCESVKKDEQRVKKVSRYSERRSERRSKDKRKDSLGEISGTEQKPELQKSKSHDESTTEIEKPAELQEISNEN